MKPSGHRKSASLPSPEEDDALWRCRRVPAPESLGIVCCRHPSGHRLAVARSHESRISVGWRLWVPAFAAVAVIALAMAWQRPWTGATEPGISLHTEEVDLLREELHLMTYVDELLTVSDPTTLDDDGLAELF